jgi:GTPase SAR1 family protein
MTEAVKYRILVFGAQRVGKRSFCARFSTCKFDDKAEVVNPSAFEVFSREMTVQNTKYCIELVHMPIGDEYKVMTYKEVQSCNGCILMYSIEHRPTLDKAKELYRMIYASKGDYFPIILLGHKADLAQRREVSIAEVQSLAQLYGITFYEASAKSGECVESVVLDLTQKILADRDRQKTQTLDDKKKTKPQTKKISIRDKCATQ